LISRTLGGMWPSLLWALRASASASQPIGRHPNDFFGLFEALMNSGEPTPTRRLVSSAALRAWMYSIIGRVRAELAPRWGRRNLAGCGVASPRRLAIWESAANTTRGIYRAVGGKWCTTARENGQLNRIVSVEGSGSAAITWHGLPPAVSAASPGPSYIQARARAFRGGSRTPPGLSRRRLGRASVVVRFPL
jgi:hypothetical protein